MSTASPRSEHSRRKMVAGNWKMNGSILANEALLEGMLASLGQLGSRIDIAICPPYPYLGQLRGALAGADGRPGPVALGAQDVAFQAPGAFTGAVAVEMLLDLSCRWVIIGHSERRALFGDTDESVARKVVRALDAGLGVIVCVGESLAEREAGQAEAVVSRQLAACASALAAAPAAQVVVAYEPVWAIGTGRTATPETAQQMHAHLRSQLRTLGCAHADAIRLLYGGSVKAANAGQLFSQPDIDGGLIGGAALQAEEFIAICQAAA